jgi:hypothetical protein
MTVALSRAETLAFRAAGHGLDQRRPPGHLAPAAAAIGFRRTKDTALALAARVEGAGDEDLHHALATEELVVVYGARGTRMVVPEADADVFTRGVAPADEASLRAAVPGAFLRRLDAAGLSVTDALSAVVEAVRQVLDGGPRSRGETATAVTRALPEVLTPPCRGRCPDPHVEDSLFRLAGVAGTMRFYGDSDDLVAMPEASASTSDEARRELLRRYLRCHGPSTPATFAAWAGIGVADAARSFAALGDDAVPAAPATRCAGIRLLPPYDPYLLDRDRATLVPDRAGQRILWRAAANPGVVLVDAEPAAAWRTRTKAGRRTLDLQLLPGGPSVDMDAVQEEAAMVLGTTTLAVVR